MSGGLLWKAVCTLIGGLAAIAIALSAAGSDRWADMLCFAGIALGAATGRIIAERRGW